MRGKIIACLILLCFCVVMNADLSAGTILVPTDYLTIQQAINNAGTGDTIIGKT